MDQQRSNIEIQTFKPAKVNVNRYTAIVVGERAFELDDFSLTRRSAQASLTAAYIAWKAKSGLEHVERNTADWNRMMAATKSEFALLESAKRDERNARKRLATAIARHRVVNARPL